MLLIFFGFFVESERLAAYDSKEDKYCDWEKKQTWSLPNCISFYYSDDGKRGSSRTN